MPGFSSSLSSNPWQDHLHARVHVFRPKVDMKRKTNEQTDAQIIWERSFGATGGSSGQAMAPLTGNWAITAITKSSVARYSAKPKRRVVEVIVVLGFDDRKNVFRIDEVLVRNSKHAETYN